ncbi:hypothetical protein ACLKA7_000143 [Drosophila subpalustris]
MSRLNRFRMLNESDFQSEDSGSQHMDTYNNIEKVNTPSTIITPTPALPLTSSSSSLSSLILPDPSTVPVPIPMPILGPAPFSGAAIPSTSAAAATAEAAGAMDTADINTVSSRHSKPPQICIYAKLTTVQQQQQQQPSGQSQQPEEANSSIVLTKRHNEINLNALIAKLNSAVGAINFDVKLGGGGTVRVNSKTPDAYRSIVRVLESDPNGIRFNTYQLREERAFRVVVRGIHASTPIGRIRDELQGMGYRVRSVQINSVISANRRIISSSPALQAHFAKIDEEQ